MLYIYRASAGSGKTFLLTRFYIELLFRKDLTPSLEGRNMLFSEILAVTFTNKATAEMKDRIIREIYTLWKSPDSSSYINNIRKPDDKGHVMSIEEVSQRAHDLLHDMLTDYSSLHISTIDSFFQQVVRSFAHEMNMQGNYEVELDANTVLDHAVTQFLLTLNPKDDPETYKWLLQFSRNRLEDGQNWNLHNDLLKLAKVLTSEDYRKHSEEVALFARDKSAMAEYVKRLDQMIGQWKNDLKATGRECSRILDESQLTAKDFCSSRIDCALKWSEGKEKVSDTIRSWAESTDGWFTKAKRDEGMARLGERAGRLQELLRQGIELIEGERQRQYRSALAIRRNIYQLGLLSCLEQAANNYCNEQGVKLLSNTTQLLNALVEGQSSPFIYEKTGTRIRSFMIDEFQDTSGMQWSNFSPLLDNSLGEGNRNLVVGDVKQSIYRWRGSDWSLLHDKINRFRRDKQATDDKGNLLTDNWRSDSRIIGFNNDFFAFASQRFKSLEPANTRLDTVANIYSDVRQTISSVRKDKYRNDPEHPGEIPEGHVLWEMSSGEKKLTKDEFAAIAMQRLPELVLEVQARGYEPRDILILCRKGEQCSLCAKTLLDYGNTHPEVRQQFQIITQEALLLYTRPVVRALIAVLEYLHDPKSAYARDVAGMCWQALGSDTMTAAIAAYMSQPAVPHFESMLNLPLYEAVERLVSMLPADARRETDFIQAFCDVVLEFCAKEGPNLDSFLSWWKEHGEGLSVTTPSTQNAIQIMTIHKSKGLAGEVVIIPFASDKLDISYKNNAPDLLWCEPSEAPFAHEHLVLPIEITQKNKDNTIFGPDIEQERMRAIIDTLNTAYVAFTRAKHELILLSPAPDKPDELSLHAFLQAYFGNALTEVAPGLQRAELGQCSYKKKNVRACEKTQVVADGTDAGNPFPELTSQREIAPSPIIKQTEYFDTENQAAIGTTLHAAFAAVHDLNDVDRPILHLFRSGMAQLGRLTEQEVLDRVHAALNQPEVRSWFDPRNRVLTEQDIIHPDTHTRRPDRIVFTPDGRCIIIDYKTGHRREERYHDQVHDYMSLMGEMGFGQIEGYLWYIETGLTERV